MLGKVQVVPRDPVDGAMKRTDVRIDVHADPSPAQVAQDEGHAQARGERTGRNPRTGDEVQVPKKLVPYFKTGKELRERLNK